MHQPGVRWPNLYSAEVVEGGYLGMQRGGECRIEEGRDLKRNAACRANR